MELAYIAGIIDGEGCICIYKTKPNIKRRSKNPCHILRVNVGNTNKLLIDWLVLKLGGNSRKLTNQSLKWKDSWQWFIESNRAVDILEQIYPYLIIKSPQAKVAIEFQKTKAKSKGRELSEQELLFREGFRGRMGILNKKGRDLLLQAYPEA